MAPEHTHLDLFSKFAFHGASSRGQVSTAIEHSSSAPVCEVAAAAHSDSATPAPESALEDAVLQKDVVIPPEAPPGESGVGVVEAGLEVTHGLGSAAAMHIFERCAYSGYRPEDLEMPQDGQVSTVAAHSDSASPAPGSAHEDAVLQRDVVIAPEAPSRESRVGVVEAGLEVSHRLGSAAAMDIFASCAYSGCRPEDLEVPKDDTPAKVPRRKRQPSSSADKMPHKASLDHSKEPEMTPPKLLEPQPGLDLHALGQFAFCDGAVKEPAKNLSTGEVDKVFMPEAEGVGRNSLEVPMKRFDEGESGETAEPHSGQSLPAVLLATPCIGATPLEEFAFGSTGLRGPTAESPSQHDAGETITTEQDATPAAVKRRRVWIPGLKKADFTRELLTSKLLEPNHAAFEEADALGLGGALRNLAARDEILNRGVPMETLLEALQGADGLVNKALQQIIQHDGSEGVAVNWQLFTGKENKPAAVKHRRVACKRVPSKLMEPEHPTFQEADELGLGGAFRNLAGREEIVNSGLPMEKLLEALVGAGGLVNKAQSVLLGI